MTEANEPIETYSTHRGDEGTGTLRFIIVAGTFISMSTGAYLAFTHNQTILAAMFGAIAAAAAIYGAQLWYDWRIDRADKVKSRRDEIRLERERHFAQMNQADADAYSTRMDTETRRIEALKIESDGRQTLIIDGYLLPKSASMIVAPKNHPMPENVPHSYHYEYNGGTETNPLQITSAETQTLALPPGGVDLLNVLQHVDPETGNVLLGLEPNGNPLIVKAKELCHVALAGATRGGKSNILRLLLAQLLAFGAYILLIDPHFTTYDAENDEDWRPIADRLAKPAAYTAKDIAKILTDLTDEMEKRMELRRQGQKIGHPIFLAVDELPKIVKLLPGAPDVLGQILREGAKVGIFVISAAQDFLVKSIGGDSAARDCYRTAYYVGGDETTARVLLDVRAQKGKALDDGTLGKGRVMLRSSANRATMAYVPRASNESIYRIMGTTPSIQGANALESLVEGLEEPTEDELAIVSSGRIVSLNSWKATRQPLTVKNSDAQLTTPTTPNLNEEQKEVLKAWKNGNTSARAIAKTTEIKRDKVNAILYHLRNIDMISGDETTEE